MNVTTISETDQMERYLRRGLWILLLLMLLIGACTTVSIGLPGTQAARIARWTLLLAFPMAIVLMVAKLIGNAKAARTDPYGMAMRALLNDELRQESLKRAYRNAFFGMLGLQALLPVAIMYISVPNPAALMSSLTTSTGMVIFVASLLHYDR
jgi:cytochrome bd-type quinol oxidase subunit 2